MARGNRNIARPLMPIRREGPVTERLLQLLRTHPGRTAVRRARRIVARTAVGHCVLLEGWRGLRDKAAFVRLVSRRGVVTALARRRCQAT